MIFGAGNLVLKDNNTGGNLAITIMHATCEYENTCHYLIQPLNQQI